jgi:hypothetical protein
MTVCDLGCASSIVCAEPFRTVAKSFTAGAHTPAAMRGIVLSAGAIRDFPDRGVLCRLLATSPFAGFPVFASPGTFAARRRLIWWRCLAS